MFSFSEKVWMSKFPELPIYNSQQLRKEKSYHSKKDLREFTCLPDK